MQLYYDFHLHSCLSPCGDALMTPANIAGMAYLNELQAVALTDHNTARNCPAFIAQAEKMGLTALAGMELTTQEEVHVLCLFAKAEEALEFDRYVYQHLIKIKNKPEVFGEQLILDENDEVIGSEPNLLINATDIPFDDAYRVITDHHGVMIPAHIDKSSTSLISNLGFVPPDSAFKCFELGHMDTYHRLKRENPYLENCRVICDSDAHYLENIHNASFSVQVQENTPQAILKALDPDYVL